MTELLKDSKQLKRKIFYTKSFRADSWSQKYIINPFPSEDDQLVRECKVIIITGSITTASRSNRICERGIYKSIG